MRWYLGYDLHEPLPDHSSLTRIRERYGLEVFRGFFERIVELCLEAPDAASVPTATRGTDRVLLVEEPAIKRASLIDAGVAVGADGT